MTTVLWIIQGVLAFAFFMAGFMKVAQPKHKVQEKMAFAEDFGKGLIKFIGFMEILGAAGLILPMLLDILPVLTPVSAAGLALVQLLAVLVHIRRNEVMMVVVNVILLGLAVVIAYWWF